MEEFKRNAIRQGNSTVVVIPKKVAEFLSIKPGDWVRVNIEKVKKK